MAGLAGCDTPSGTLIEMPWNQVAPRTPRNQVQPRSPITGASAWDSVQGARPWRYIVIHHSASERGNAASIDVAHRARGWDELGYHFVIDNGSGGADGQVEVGHRWQIQKWGAHTGGTPDNAYNKYGIGICLVGNMSNHYPSARQIASLERLVSYLVAKYNISPQNIIGHRDAPNAKTECPGNTLHSYIWRTLRPSLARR